MVIGTPKSRDSSGLCRRGKVHGVWGVSPRESTRRSRDRSPMSTLLPFAAFLLAAATATAAPEPEVIARARAEGLPVELLEAKWREARLKRVDPARAMPVIESLAGHLRTADRLVPEPPSPARPRVVASVAQALEAGAEPVSLAAALAQARDSNARELGAQAIASLVLAKVPAATAARLVSVALKEGLTDRLLSVRPAVEMLRGAGLGEQEVVGRLERTLSEGRPPLEAVGTSRRDVTGAPSHAQGHGSAAPDRDRSDREEKSGEKSPPRGSGNNNGKGKGRTP